MWRKLKIFVCGSAEYLIFLFFYEEKNDFLRWKGIFCEGGGVGEAGTPRKTGQQKKTLQKRSRTRETQNLSTDAVSSTALLGISSSSISSSPQSATSLILPTACCLVDPDNRLLPGWSCQRAAAWLILPEKKSHGKGTHKQIDKHTNRYRDY